MRERLSRKELIVMGGAVFSMHFGAACMLYPVQWGSEAGKTVLLMFLGVLVSEIMLPFLGYFALIKGEGSFLSLTKTVAPKFGTLIIGLTLLVLGPVFLVPRMSAAAWSAIVQLTGYHPNSSVAIILFSIAYYLLTFWFVSSEGQVMDRIGKILFPVLIIVVVAVIVKAIVTPISDQWTEPAFTQNPVVQGFLSGYSTGDLMCAVIFGVIVVNGIKAADIKSSEHGKTLLKISAIGLGLLMLSMLGHMIAGANTGGTINLTYSALYTEMVVQLWGRVGGVFFNIALVAAALTTAVGAVSSTSNIWVEMLKDKNSKLFKYKYICAASCIFSCLISIAGLDTIISAIGPILDMCYPPVIVLVLYYCFCPKKYNTVYLRAAKCAMISAFTISFIALIDLYNEMFSLGLTWLSAAYNALPLSNYSLSWSWISLLVYIVSVLIFIGKENEVLEPAEIMEQVKY